MEDGSVTLTVEYGTRSTFTVSRKLLSTCYRRWVKNDVLHIQESKDSDPIEIPADIQSENHDDFEYPNKYLIDGIPCKFVRPEL
tara:strand:- start:1036 stop:1287 length:252 start_codon:yes stop_codon:yes gene_type:complete